MTAFCEIGSNRAVGVDRSYRVSKTQVICSQWCKMQCNSLLTHSTSLENAMVYLNEHILSQRRSVAGKRSVLKYLNKLQSCKNRNSRGTEWPFMNWIQMIGSLLLIFVVSVFRLLNGECRVVMAIGNVSIQASTFTTKFNSIPKANWLINISFRLSNKQLDNLEKEKRSTADSLKYAIDLHSDGASRFDNI